MRKKVLITGATGFVGAAVLRELLNNGHNVKALVRTSSDLQNLKGLNIEIVYGDLKDKDVLIIDDMIDTAGTLAKAAELIMEKGAKSVRAIATHGVLSGPAYERLDNSLLTEIAITDSIPLKNTSVSKIKVLSCAPLFADVMHLVHSNKSISQRFVI